MANRMISYGYGIENGAITVIPSEAEIVKEIFNAYLSGKILKEIAIDLSEAEVIGIRIPSCVLFKTKNI